MFFGSMMMMMMQSSLEEEEEEEEEEESSTNRLTHRLVLRNNFSDVSFNLDRRVRASPPGRIVSAVRA